MAMSDFYIDPDYVLDLDEETKRYINEIHELWEAEENDR